MKIKSKNSIAYNINELVKMGRDLGQIIDDLLGPVGRQEAVGNNWFVFEDGSVLWQNPESGDIGFHNSKPFYLN